MSANTNNQPSKHRKLFRRLLKLILWLITVPIALVLLVMIALQFPQTQKYVTHKATAYLSTKLKTNVELERITIAFPKSIELHHLYVEDLTSDTLLYGELIKVDLNVWDLLSKKIVLNSVELRTITGHVSRNPTDSTFNFSFIPKAFSSPNSTPEVKDTTATPWDFSIKNVVLTSVYVTYNDDVMGTQAILHVGSLETHLKNFDLSNKKIHVSTLVMKETQALVIQNKSASRPEKVESTKPFDYDLAVDNLVLDKVQADYTNTVNGQQAHVQVGHLQIIPDKIDILHQTIALTKISLTETSASYTVSKQGIMDTLKPRALTDTILKPLPFWLITLKQLEFKNNTVTYDNQLATPLPKGFDANHIKADHITILANNLYVSPSKASLQLNDFILQEQSGFGLRHFSSKISYDSTHLELANLNLQTNHSSIGDHLGIKFHSLQTLKDSIGNLYADLHFDGTRIAAKDLLYFAPHLLKQPSLQVSEETVIHLSGGIKGLVDDLHVSDLNLSTLQQTHITLNGSIKNIIHPDMLYANIDFFEVQSSRKDVYQAVSATVLPKTITIPETFIVKGSWMGYIKNFNATVDLKTAIGNVTGKVTMNPKAGNKEQPYQAAFATEHFDIGQLLNQSQNFGPATITVSVIGQGFDLNTMNTQANLYLEQAMIKGYDYKSLKAVASINKKVVTFNSSLNDSNLVFQLDGHVDLDTMHPAYVFKLDVPGADLKALKLSTEDVRISTTIESDMQQKTGHNITGKASLKNTLLIRNGRRFPIDSLVVLSTEQQGVSDISVRSEILTADMHGTFALKELPTAFKQHLNTYFKMNSDAEQKKTAPQNFTFQVSLIDPSLFAGSVIPDLQKLDPLTIQGRYNNAAKDVSVAVNIPLVVYKGIHIDSLKLDLSSNPEAFQYTLQVAELSNPTLKFENLSLGGALKENALSFQLTTVKDDSTKNLAIGGLLKSLSTDFELTLNPELILNTEKWSMDPSNSLHFGKDVFRASQVVLSKGVQALSVNSLSQEANAPLEIKFNHFDLSTLSKLIENRKELIKGQVDGTVILEKKQNKSAFTSDLTIDQFAFQSIPVGTIKLKANNTNDPERYVVDLTVQGNGNDIGITGTYSTRSTDQALDFLAEIKTLSLASVEPFTFGQVSRMSGNMQGKLAITGSTSAPVIAGELALKEATLKPAFIDSYLTIPDGHLTFQSKKMMLSNFTVYDSLQNKAVLDGYVNLADLKQPEFDVRITSKNFLALNTTKKQNALYFGRVFLDSDIHATGTIDSPVLEVKAKLNKGSSITYIKPESQVGKIESEGIVVFVDSLDTRKKIMTRQRDSLNERSQIKGIDLKARINFDKTVELKMLVDQSSGDSLYIIGGGELDFSLDKSGKTNLIGKYRISDGGYHLSISEVLKRDFRIEKGSSVTWSGDILDAYVDIKAIYTIKTSPIDLVQNELSGVTELEKNKYRNLLTFLVYLKMSGFISSPEISFDIQLDPKDKGAMNGTVNAKLEELREDETQLNKQVFALLTLRRFIGENPLDNGNEGGGLSSASRTSASKILTQQLNNLSDKYVKFVDLDLGVNSYEDYSTGQEEGRTQLQVGVSKQLFDDKVTVRVGGNVELEGEKSKQNNASDVAGNINIDYKLTDDGRYKLKGFRENQYENPIEGELIKTGVGIIYVRNYNRLKELFKKPEKITQTKEPKNPQKK